MSVQPTVQTSKLVCGIDVSDMIPSAGTAIINGPMYVGSPIPGPALVNITLPTGIPSIKSLASSSIALNIVAPGSGLVVTAPVAAKLIGSTSITGKTTITGFTNIIGRTNILERLVVGKASEVLNSFTVGKSCNVLGNLTIGGTITSAWLEAKLAKKKSFDINHPSKPETHRLRYVCLEGEEAGVYLRGKLKDSNTITLPDYFKDLVDIETIVVNLTPVGKYQELFVDDIRWGKQIIVKNNLGGSINCHYTIFAERKDVDKNIPEYEGTSPNDYPGDNSVYRIG